ncbi:MAG TPA: hypothetical protein VMQ60_07855 [Acidobacteriaceae bacterium]|nr:hypothetical protein [Acidobacteriaceae bacterium]
MGQLWYCSVDCFATATRKRFSMLAGASILEMPHHPRLSIGLVMLSKGYLTDDQLRFAMAESRLHGEELEAVLVRLGLASERQLAVARAAQWGYPILGQDRMGQPVESDIPPTLLHACTAVPLHCSTAAKRFLLGFVYRVEHSLLNSVELVTGFRAEPCFITPTEFREQTGRLTTVPGCEEVVFEDPSSPVEMANLVASFALEVAAREANFAHCRDYTWTRLSGKRRMIDVLFRVKNAADAGKMRNFLMPKESIRSVG